jgi:uncharacterized protein (DUF488 family)
MEILTVGHSTHSIEEFCALLAGADVNAIADVRRYPGSRRNPQFGATALAASLGAAGIAYESFAESLGGRRGAKDRPQAPAAAPDNSAWRSASFRAYADYMTSPAFESGLVQLEALGRTRRIAIMCAEAHPSRCHRQLISDALFARGWEVVHLLADGRLQTHVAAAHAVIADGQVSYPGQPTLDV